MAPSQAQPSAKFSFNYGSNEDEITGKKAKLIGASYVPDRFGNDNCAIFMAGNEYSYINLGTHKQLKPKIGTIALWVKIEHKVWSGTGTKYNPVIITKYTFRDDFYESFAIYYMLETDRIVGVAARDSARDLGLFSNKGFERNAWHHLAICYDDEQFWLYIDAKLEGKVPKKFDTKFLGSDSVMVGTTANKKNNRSFNGIVDDIEFYSRVLTDKEIKTLYDAPDPNRKWLLIKKILYTAIILLVILSVFLLIRYYIHTSIRKGKERLELANKLLENELRINRALMNPHFVFNSMNTLQNYILTHDYEKASNYLVKFSRLIRKILDSNMSDSITLEMEVELLERYLEIESLRFKEQITSAIIIDPVLVTSSISIPIMMLQPFVENAVWHGLRKKVGSKEINITLSLLEDKYVECVIEDNGTGRKKNRPDIGKKKSLATNFIIQRLELLNKIHSTNASLSITDKPFGRGTIVKIVLPILNKS